MRSELILQRVSLCVSVSVSICEWFFFSIQNKWAIGHFVFSSLITIFIAFFNHRFFLSLLVAATCRFNQYDIKYSGHENRPKNLLLKSVTTNVPSQDLILGSYFANSNNSCSTTMTSSSLSTTTTAMSATGTIRPTSTTTAMVTAVTLGPTTTTTASANATSIDLDINVHAIKNMLMATRVPESCV